MSFKSMLCRLTIVSLVALSGFANGTKPKGELALASSTTVNNVVAQSGTTLFSNNRIKTAENGGAVISLGKAGRIELAAGTDLTLQLSPGSIGGTLSAGRLIISTPAGVQIHLATHDSTITSMPNQSSRLVVDLRAGKTNVLAKTGAASVTARGRISVIGVVGATGEVQGMAKKYAPVGNKTASSEAATNPTMSLLLKSAAGQSLDAFLTGRATNTQGGFFYPSITCKDYIDTPRCTRRSPKQ